MLGYFVLSVVISFVLTALLSKKFIPALISRKMGQPILEIGPRWHKSKEGTPTMGGLFFIAAITVAMIILSFFAIPRDSLLRVWLTLGMAILFGLIGFIDDRAKLLKRRNEGLRAYQKFLLQLVVSALYLWAMSAFAGLTTALYIPFFGVAFDLGPAYYLLALILIAGINNSVNLTDGIDGLCASVSAVVAAFFAVWGFAAPHAGIQDGALALLAGALFGGCVGFLVYNWHPARVFMGDTGSLFIGGLVTGLAFLTQMPSSEGTYGNALVILPIGLFYLVETVSVILQVGYFKLSHGKRLFKMAPIHHHFEQCGWSEPAIVALSIALTAVMSIITYCFL